MHYVAVPAAEELDDSAAGPAGRTDDKRVSNARLHGLGFVLTYPTFREGYADLLDR